jgi:hypothetical protein
VLPQVHFDIINMINASTGFSLFQLCMGCSPHIIPPLVQSEDEEFTDIHTTTVIERLRLNVLEAQDNMLHAKISQALAANEHHTDDFPFKKGGQVVLSTLHRRHDHKAKGEKRVAKFMLCFDGLYLITDTTSNSSTVTIELPNHLNMFPTFHASQVWQFVENNKGLFPGYELEKPPLVFVGEEEEYFVDQILDEHRWGWRMQYLVHWLDYEPKEDQWLPAHELAKCEALNIWLAKCKLVASM